MAHHMASPQTFVCLDCGSVIEQPRAENGILRCSAGHRVQGLKSRPLWQVGIFSFGIAFWILSIVIHLFQTVWLARASPMVVWFLLVVLAAWSAYLGFR